METIFELAIEKDVVVAMIRLSVEVTNTTRVIIENFHYYCQKY